jgi:hypothetical protein
VPRQHSISGLNSTASAAPAPGSLSQRENAPLRAAMRDQQTKSHPEASFINLTRPVAPIVGEEIAAAPKKPDNKTVQLKPTLPSVGRIGFARRDEHA